MLKRNFYFFCGVVAAISFAAFSLSSLSKGNAIDTSAKTNLANSSTTLSPSDEKGKATVVFAGGCFWGVEAVFEHLKGVTNVVSGYSGGTADTAHYETVSSGQTGHAESVKITYDPSQISYEQLLKVYFLVAHDPTQLNRQGPDRGTQYRSAIFFANAEQKQIAETYIARLNQEKAFSKPIVTQVVPLQSFYAAEDYHQDFIVHNPNYPYVVVHDLPKLEQLRKQFPEMYK
ncbi:peptide-methionine (S)-S-oxide reductase MsrA [Tumidithrix elongata RA019]|uniref:Peptide methionine sulfoxide reductase MsrA n=1 Tax=Tumidithrix elongata BACA0141 TaxID=2716417 RepID=A0AAW9Q993_9CYAN|nr:peptide-methionine (S)-S-oxide reductase MsrA [Tumidithrix elongata RA019]